MTGVEDSTIGQETTHVEEDDCADASCAEGVPAVGAEDAQTSEADELPELMDLLDEIEEAGDDADTLAKVLRRIGRRIRASPGDRDLLTDFDGIANICKILGSSEVNWQGEAMLVLCKIMPDVCRTSNVNRGSLRDEGFLAAAVDLLRAAVEGGDESGAIAACTAISAMCTANDGNKKVAAKLAESSPEKPGGIMLCLDALARFPESVALQTEAVCALRTLITDDDSRRSASEPSAVENREVALSDTGFPLLGVAVERALDVADASDAPQVRLREQALLLLREMARRQDTVKALALEAKLLPRVLKALEVNDARVVRASLAALRSFCVAEEVRDEIGLLTDGAYQCILAVHRHMATPVVCEQGFGLFANLTMRKSPMIAAKLNEGERGIVAVAKDVFLQHAARQDVMKSVIHTLRNVAIQDEASCTEIKEVDIFDEVRKIVKAHEGDTRWSGAVDISRQFLREWREDDGMEKKAVYNAFY